MPFKDVEAQKKFQREWVANRKRIYLADKLCGCGKAATEVYGARTKGKTFVWSSTNATIQEKLKFATLCCEPCYDGMNALRFSELNTKHGHARGGSTIHYSRTYHSWRAMTERCTNPNKDNWKYYGGRGVTICARWLGEHGFENFLADMGERPYEMTLDRRDPFGNYEPGNCRWATAATQGANKRKNAVRLAKAA